jgi:cell division protein FtsI/penicillin-binding protein 2
VLGRRFFAPVALLGALVVGAPAPTRASADPGVDLGRIRSDGDAATAPRAGGEDALLTLDPGLHAAAQKLLARARPVAGAVVAVDAHNGKVLAFADVSADGAPGDVLLDKQVPAASLFKLVTTAALIERGRVHPKQTVCTDGGTRRIERKHLERPRSGKALCAPFRSALGHSRNAVYAQLVTRHLMRSDLVDMGDRFGFNRTVPFDGARVATGRLEVPFADLDFARTAAGFRGSTLGVLGALELAAIVAHGGRTLPLRILDETSPTKAARVIHASTAAELRRMMEVTVHSGTSFEAFSDADKRPLLPGIRVAGKTGTLQPDANDPTTSWFVGFAPSKSPEIVVGVLLLNGKVWRQRANELARDLLRVHFVARGRRGIEDPLQR